MMSGSFQTGKLGPIPLAGLNNLNGLAAGAGNGFGNASALNPAGENWKIWISAHFTSNIKQSSKWFQLPF